VSAPIHADLFAQPVHVGLRDADRHAGKRTGLVVIVAVVVTTAGADGRAPAFDGGIGAWRRRGRRPGVAAATATAASEGAQDTAHAVRHWRL
jgi:hypothetical protein